jgi:hypothetical protein
VTVLRDALDAIQAPTAAVHALSAPVVHALPVSGAAVSTFGRVLPVETLSASDDRALRIDEIQFDLHEGPCWDALATGRPVLEPDIQRRPVRVWPAFSPAIGEVSIGGLFAYPLIFGPLRLGALDLYTDLPLEWSPQAAADAEALAQALARTVLRSAIDREAAGADEGPHSRRLIHQATGMVIAQLRVSPDDAELLIRGHAFATGEPMRAVAERIIARDLQFRRGAEGIEVSS